MKNLLNWLKNEESGQGMVEYGLLIAFISVVAIAAIFGIGSKVKDFFSDANTAVHTTAP